MHHLALRRLADQLIARRLDRLREPLDDLPLCGWACMPFDAIALTAFLTSASVTWHPNACHVFQPIGGVAASFGFCAGAFATNRMIAKTAHEKRAANLEMSRFITLNTNIRFASLVPFVIDSIFCYFRSTAFCRSVLSRSRPRPAIQWVTK